MDDFKRLALIVRKRKLTGPPIVTGTPRDTMINTPQGSGNILNGHVGSCCDVQNGLVPGKSLVSFTRVGSERGGLIVVDVDAFFGRANGRGI